jgi:hypothetical protein
MARKEKKPKAPRKPSPLATWWKNLDADARKGVLRGTAVAVVVSVIGVAAVYGGARLHDYVMRSRQEAGPLASQVQLTAWPQWMPTALAADIAHSLTPEVAFCDDAVTQDVYERAAVNPWIKRVTLVTKRSSGDPRYGIIDVQAEYRQPAVAVAVAGGEDVFVDADGVVLPAHQVPRWIARLPAAGDAPARTVCFISGEDVPQRLAAEPIHYLRVEGVAAAPPAVGQKWAGDDLADGIRLAMLVYARKYCQQVQVVDVRNHNGRHSKSLASFLLVARGGGRTTSIRVERFALPEGDYVIAPQRGLLNLDEYYRQHGTIAGLHEYIDLRHERLATSIQ